MNILFGHYVADAGTIEVFGNPLPAGSPNAAIEVGVGMTVAGAMTWIFLELASFE
jgi:ABC-type uncharacterized transport system ATPase subunit